VNYTSPPLGSDIKGVIRTRVLHSSASLIIVHVIGVRRSHHEDNAPTERQQSANGEQRGRERTKRERERINRTALPVWSSSPLIGRP